MSQLSNLIELIQNSRNSLFILCGFPYAGKSYIAKQLVDRTDIVFVSIDDIFHNHEFEWNTNKLPNREQWEKIFNESYEQTKQALMNGKNVLYDSTNQTVASRDKLREVSATVNADTKVIYIKSPVETVWKRLEDNQSDPSRSVVSKELVQMTIEMFEEPTEDENVIIVKN